VNEKNYNVNYQGSTFEICQICAKLGLGALISSLWKHYMINGARFDNDD